MTAVQLLDKQHVHGVRELWRVSRLAWIPLVLDMSYVISEVNFLAAVLIQPKWWHFYTYIFDSKHGSKSTGTFCSSRHNGCIL
jgi:hypothetical protein